MLKRFKPAQPDGSKKEFNLPDNYIGGPITLFVNGQMVYSQDNPDDPYGYTLDEDNKKFTFYEAPQSDDTLFVLYDSDGSSITKDLSGTGLMRLRKGYNLVSFQGKALSHWDKDNSKVNYDENILANVQNLIIDQIVDVYGTDIAGEYGEKIIREISTYDDDTGKYRTFKPGATDKMWTGDGEHTTNEDLEKTPTEYDYSEYDKVYYNPNNFILAKCLIKEDSDGNKVLVSGDVDNNLEDLPMGLRTGLSIYIYPDADLSKTDDVLEIWF